MNEFCYDELIVKFRKNNMKRNNEISMLLNIIQFLLYSCDNPKLTFGYIL